MAAPKVAPPPLRRIVMREMMPGGWSIEDDADLVPNRERVKDLAKGDDAAVRAVAQLLGVELDGPKCGPDRVCSASPKLPISDEELRGELSKPAGIFIQTLDFEADAEKLAEARAIIAGLLGAFASENHGDRARLAAKAANFLAPV
ncbi:hypothetical protein EYE35_01170 [Cereibacter sphaeroides]|nr:hypothetical protein EYE35_01170 [Cereibacter sphaeroides]